MMAGNPNLTSPAVVPVTNLVFRSPTYRIIYSNVFNVRPSGSDIALTFAVQTVMPVPNEAGIVIPSLVNQEEVTIMLTLSALKVLSRHISGIVEIAEEKFGPIKVPKIALPTEEQREAIRHTFDGIELSDE